jgi:hypothetical protein
MKRRGLSREIRFFIFPVRKNGIRYFRQIFLFKTGKMRIKETLYPVDGLEI